MLTCRAKLSLTSSTHTCLEMEQALAGRGPVVAVSRPLPVQDVPLHRQALDRAGDQVISRRQSGRTCRLQCRASRPAAPVWQEAGAAILGAGVGASLVDAAVRASPAAAADLVTQVGHDTHHLKVASCEASAIWVHGCQACIAQTLQTQRKE